MTYEEKHYLCLSLLNDDHGITASAFRRLIRLRLVPGNIRRAASIQDGRVFIKTEDVHQITIPLNPTLVASGRFSVEVSTLDDEE